MTTTFGLFYSYTDFFLPLAQQFHWSHMLDSVIPAVSLITFSVGTVVVAFMFSRAGFRKMCLLGSTLVGSGLLLSSQINSFAELLVTFSLLIPLGISIFATATSAIVVKWFIKKRALAIGLTTTGAGIGTLIVSPIAGLIIVMSGWRVCFIVLGIAFFFVLLLASIFIRTPEEVSERPYGWNESTDSRENVVEYTLRGALSTRQYWTVYAMFFFANFGTVVFSVHAVPFASSHGISQVQAADAVGFFGLGSIGARIASGVMSDTFGRARSLVLAFTSEFLGIVSLPYVGSSALLLSLCAFAIGLGFGISLAGLIVLTGDIFGRRWIERTWAIQETATGLAGLTGPVIVGAYFDTFHSYGGAFDITSVVVGAALVISVFFAHDFGKIKLAL
jgi:MFS transporter, OFA family, oxalate/formate antiporter